ncbi:hypothetical protein [Jannaschia seosinensis]|uniref:hypothetical protein n=1 Tax=Jannaschia seosinensis TaxID=313367 RepID=UPI000AF747D5|nr:hypothetical protein [Jannaschia seosinensis]
MSDRVAPGAFAIVARINGATRLIITLFLTVDVPSRMITFPRDDPRSSWQDRF